MSLRLALTITEDGTAWQARGNCANVHPDRMHPDEKDTQGIEDAKATCVGCPVLELCREAHLGEKYGVWGGLSEKERRGLMRMRSGRAA